MRNRRNEMKRQNENEIGTNGGNENEKSRVTGRIYRQIENDIPI